MLPSLRLNIVTYVYGSYIDLFEKVCLRSLMQAGNVPHLISCGYNITHLIYTTTPDVEKIEKIIGKYSTDRLEFKIMTNNAVGYGRNLAKTNMIFLVESVAYCVSNPCPMFLATPDVFIGDGSLSNLVSYNAKKDICLAALHVRVDRDKFLNWIKGIEGGVSNPALVTAGMGMLSQSWADSFIDRDKNCSWHAGTAVQKIKDKLWAVSFRIPTVYLARLNQSDMDYFNNHCDYGHWDHSWPESLIKDKRYKLIGSSDLFFAVEVTSAENNKAMLRDNDTWNDECQNTKLHSETNRNFLAIIRGE
ncbi:MAG: hypothetical protein Q8O68_00960 [Candidatus Daviesbacteria bacterium]|nr:hypothetical protein [Candidatus Daviesbacteria bacterium]